MKKPSGLILKGKTEVYSSDANARNYPNAVAEKTWQYFFRPIVIGLPPQRCGAAASSGLKVVATGNKKGGSGGGY
jgi:hypothetical protein